VSRVDGDASREATDQLSRRGRAVMWWTCPILSVDTFALGRDPRVCSETRRTKTSGRVPSKKLQSVL